MNADTILSQSSLVKLTLNRKLAAGVSSANHQFVASFIGGVGPVEDQALLGSLCHHLDALAGRQQVVIVVPFDRADILSGDLGLQDGLGALNGTCVLQWDQHANCCNTRLNCL